MDLLSALMSLSKLWDEFLRSWAETCFCKERRIVGEKFVGGEMRMVSGRIGLRKKRANRSKTR